MILTRRDFIKSTLGSLAYISTAASVPVWVAKSAQALAGEGLGDRILVLIQLAGGNDGLNTLIPHQDDNYFNARPNVAIQVDNPIDIGDGLNSFHPRLVGIRNWYDEGNVAFIQNVGYPNPNGSHFLSTDFVEFGTSPGSRILPSGQGWISRFFDNACEGVPPENIPALSMLALNTPLLPDSLNGGSYLSPRLNNLGQFNLRSRTDIRGRYFAAINRLNVPNSDLDYIQRVENVVEASIDDFAEANAVPDLREYSTGALGLGLRSTSKLIRSGADTRLYYCNQAGYDTHANQFRGATFAGDHANLIGEFDNAVTAFLQDMKDSGNLHRVLILTFSEFGRRVAENGSNGTDHGGGNMFMAFGGGVNGGVFGGQPDLRTENLVRGNLNHKIDFRSIFSNVIKDWFNQDPAITFGADFTDPIFKIPEGMLLAPFVNVNAGPGEGEGEG
jgi:uncharacterized protein (DUF1501 family)